MYGEYIMEVWILILSVRKGRDGPGYATDVERIARRCHEFVSHKYRSTKVPEFLCNNIFFRVYFFIGNLFSVRVRSPKPFHRPCAVSSGCCRSASSTVTVVSGLLLRAEWWTRALCSKRLTDDAFDLSLELNAHWLFLEHSSCERKQQAD